MLTLCLCVATTVGAFAQKGEMAAGISFGYAPCLESGASVNNLGFGAKFQYNVTDPIRLEADVDYWLKDKGLDVFDVSANAHYLFNASEKFKVYPLIGVGVAKVKASADVEVFGDEYEVSASTTKFLLNVGLGAEYALTEKIAINVEAKFQYIKDFNRLPIKVGVAYKF